MRQTKSLTLERLSEYGRMSKQMDDKTLKIGISKKDITPEIGTALFGYIPDFLSTSVHDRLNVTVLYIEQSEVKALIVSVDNGEISTLLTDRIREKLSADSGIPRDSIFVAATHTHSAPNLSGMKGWGDVDRKYYENVFLPAVCKAVEDAIGSSVPAKIGVSAADSYVGINRRQILENGEVALGQNPHGEFDPEMTVIAFRGPDGRPLANVVHYGCHGTASGCNPAISRDWMGIMCDRLEKESGAMTMFLNGAEGDVGPRLSNGMTTGNISYMEELGGIAASDAVRIWKSIREYRDGTSVELLSDEIRIPYRSLPERSTVEKGLEKYINPESMVNIERGEYEHLLEIKEVYDKSLPIPDNFTFRQSIITLGNVAFVPFPFEMFSGITLRLRDHSPFAYTLSLSNCNGSNGYLPTLDQICRGGYEVRSFMAGKTFTLVDNAEQHFVDENLRLLRIIKNGN